MEVTGTTEFNYSCGWVKTFSDIVYIHKVIFWLDLPLRLFTICHHFVLITWLLYVLWLILAIFSALMSLHLACWNFSLLAMGPSSYISLKRWHFPLGFLSALVIWPSFVSRLLGDCFVCNEEVYCLENCEIKVWYQSKPNLLLCVLIMVDL